MKNSSVAFFDNQILICTIQYDLASKSSGHLVTLGYSWSWRLFSTLLLLRNDSYMIFYQQSVGSKVYYVFVV